MTQDAAVKDEVQNLLERAETLLGTLLDLQIEDDHEAMLSIVDSLPDDVELAGVAPDRVKLNERELNAIVVKRNFRAIGDFINHQNIRIAGQDEHLVKMNQMLGALMMRVDAQDRVIGLLRAQQYGSGPTVVPIGPVT